MKKIELFYYDKKTNIKEDFNFLKSLIIKSVKGLLISILFIVFLIALDYTAKQIASTLYNSTNSILKTCANFLYEVNNRIGIKYLDYFKDIIVMVSGILGVILALFFTTFLNIITSKYSNLNKTIVRQILEQDQINRYLKLLSILICSSIIFQFFLVMGYNPTIISAFLFSLVIIIALLSFIFVGKFSLRYLNVGNLVSDISTSNRKVLERINKKNKYYYTNQDWKYILTLFLHYIELISLFTKESEKTKLSNTDLNNISNEFLNFAQSYNRNKYIIPSNKNLHQKTMKQKRWDEATSIDLEIASITGPYLNTEKKDDYFYLERKIINTQFLIISKIKDSNEKAQLINYQNRYLHTISFQCEFELFKLFFDKLELLIKDNIKSTNKKEIKENLLFISSFACLFTNYLIGLNSYIEKNITSKNLKKLAKAIHNFENTYTIIQFPYSIRIWMDAYHQKLLNEKFINNEILTPLFYTEFELATQFKNVLETSFKKIVIDMHKRILAFDQYLRTKNLKLESFILLYESLQVYKRIDYSCKTIGNKINQDINNLNLKREEKISFSVKDSLIKKNNNFQKEITNRIWQVGGSSYELNDKNLPDIYGNFYQFICEDILNKSFENKANDLIKSLPLFYKYNILYILKIMKKIDKDQSDFPNAKLYPIIIDLFEISSIAIVMFKAYNNDELKNSFYKFWNITSKEIIKDEKRFWRKIFSIYKYYNNLILNNPFYSKEENRKMRLKEFLRESDLTRLEKEKDAYFIDTKHYVIDSEDIYLKEAVREIDTGDYSGIFFEKLSELFIEYYLRTRITLKDLNIKETTYGSNIKRHMGRDY